MPGRNIPEAMWSRVNTDDDYVLADLLDWMSEHLAEPLPVPVLASRAVMSERTFARRFRAATGTTPHRWLTLQRVLLAQRLLEDTALGIDVAQRCGLPFDAVAEAARALHDAGLIKD